jgi:hypothetical protein
MTYLLVRFEIVAIQPPHSVLFNGQLHDRIGSLQSRAHLLGESVVLLDKHVSIINFVRVTEKPKLPAARGPGTTTPYPTSIAEALIAGAPRK